MILDFAEDYYRINVHSWTGRRFYRIQLYTLITLHPTQHGTTLYDQNSTPHKSTRPQLDTAQLNTPQLDTSQLYTDHMAVRLKLLYSSERYEQSINVITIRQKSRNTSDTFICTVLYSIIASTLRPYGLCRIRACRVVAV